MSGSVARILSSLAAGLVFGWGLVLSGMADPGKVLNFLDLFGSWDPSLMFVMGAAVCVTFVGYRLALARGKPLFDVSFSVPASRVIDTRLVSGAAIFGIGWGLAGFCPGPALSSLLLGAEGTYVFVAAMLAGMWLGRQVPG